MTLLREKDKGNQDKTGAGVPLEPRARYEDDAYTWALQQAALLRAGRVGELDIVNLADEVTDLADREYDRLESVLERLIHQLLVWDHQPAQRTSSRALTIGNQRRRVSRHLTRLPSLADRRHMALHHAFRFARYAALRETDLPEAALPADNPYSWDDAMSRDVARHEPDRCGP